MSGRRSFVPDPPHVILKRLRFVRLKLRPILYRMPVIEPPYKRKEAPCWGDRHKQVAEWYAREYTWAWEVKEHVSFQRFRYSEILQVAEKFVESSSCPPYPPTDLVGDLELLKAFRVYIRAIRKAESRTDFSIYTDQLKTEITIENHVKTCLLDQCCPNCGSDLPCVECNVPAVKFDGKGGLIPA